MTLAPGLSWANGGADGGDLITAAAINGVPHPTGYPLYMLLAKLFQWLPVGELAFRTNLLSALCTILAALLLYQTVSYINKEKKYADLSSVIAALLFGLSPLVWSQAVIAEVYGLQSLLTIGIFYQTIRMGGKPYQDLLRGFLFGLALGNHITTIFLLPLLLLDAQQFRVSQKSHLLIRFFGLLAGAAVYLILPIRAAQQPVINWFNPVNFTSFFQLISGQIYQTYFSFNYIIDHARAWAGVLVENFSIPGIVIGIFSLLDSEINKSEKLLAFWIFCVYGLFALFYVSYDSYIYLIPTILAFSIWIGLGINSLITYFMDRWRRAGWIMILLIVLFFFLRINSTIPKVNASNDDRAELFGQTVMDKVPENALVFTKDDQTTFALWYFHFALEKRSDINVIAEGLLGFEWYRQSLRSTYPDLKIPELSNLSAYHLTLKNPNNPYCYVNYQDKTKINCYHFLSE